MTLWVFRASAAAPMRVEDGPGRTVKAADWVETLSLGRRAVQHTWLVDAADAGPERLLGSLVMSDEGAWSVRAEPAHDGMYHDLPSGRVFTVSGGAIVRSEQLS